MNNTIEYVDGLKFSANSELEKYRALSIYEKEPETIAWIDSWLSDAIVFIDIGANIGIYSMYAAHKHRSSKVYSIEPVFMNYCALQKNRELNNFENVYPINIAISNVNSIQKLSVTDDRVGNSGAQILAKANKQTDISFIKTETVLVFTLDDLIRIHDLGSPTHIKIDVDGIESLILDGMDWILRSSTLMSVLVEFNSLQEFKIWEKRFENYNMVLDHSYDGIEGHSSIRRKSRGSMIRNYIFSKR